MMEKIKNLLFRLNHFFDFLYYFQYSAIKNVYPFKLMGEKINSIKVEKIIVYKILGRDVFEISLKELIENKKILEKFHPQEALKLGILSFEEIISNFSTAIRKDKFEHIKNIMLNSIHDICPIKIDANLTPQNDYLKSSNIVDDFEPFVSHNVYTCKLAGWKPNAKTTTIIFTILGKKEGYEKPLKELLENKELLSKFHPTETVKFGFINAGDSLFQTPNI